MSEAIALFIWILASLCQAAVAEEPTAEVVLPYCEALPVPMIPIQFENAGSDSFRAMISFEPTTLFSKRILIAENGLHHRLQETDVGLVQWAPSFRSRDLVFEKVGALFAEQNYLNQWNGRPDVLLGIDALKDCVLTLGPKEKQLRIERFSASGKLSEEPQLVVVVGSESISFRINLTLPYSLQLSENTAHRLLHSTSQSLRFHQQIGPRGGRIVELKDAKIADVNFDSLYGVVSGVRDEIGTMALNRFKTIIDLRNSSVQLSCEFPEAFCDHSFLDGMFLGLVQNGNSTHVIVEDILDGSIAMRTGLREGDILCGFGEWNSDLGLDKLRIALGAASVPRNEIVLVKVNRLDEELSMPLVSKAK